MFTRSSGGVPVGDSADDLQILRSSPNVLAPKQGLRYNLSLYPQDAKFVNNHWNIDIHYKEAHGLYYIVRTKIEPFSVQQYNHVTSEALLPSCAQETSRVDELQHTIYGMFLSVPMQPLTGSSKVYFTYDVTWVKDYDVYYSNRWSVLLSADGYFSHQAFSLLAGFGLGLIILFALVGALATWILRDFSYKPVVDQDLVEECTEEQATEMKMWPLSTRIFFPPSHAPVAMCIACGTGAQLLGTSFLGIALFRFGIINESQGAGLLTPFIILYAICATIGGYVTARLYKIFHGEMKVALASCLCTAIAYPLVGVLILFLTYDVLPDSKAPSFHVMSNLTPLILVWILFVWPLTVLSGYVGHRSGPLHSFPISEGSSGYQDLDLPETSESDAMQANRQEVRNSCAQRYRMGLLLAMGGVLPVLSCFVSYSYGIAGPVYRGLYSARPYSLASYLVFMLISGTVAVLLHYRQIRSNLYEWWWPSFAVSGSSGVYIFVLSISYMIFRSESSIGASALAIYVLWFGYIACGVALTTGFVGVAMCAWFTKSMYAYIMRQNHAS
jgi:transmembrane 9 superfamily member 2/4